MVTILFKAKSYDRYARRYKSCIDGEDDKKKQVMVRIKKEQEKAKVGSTVCTPKPNIELKFKVRVLDKKYIMDLNQISYLYREWGLIDIPCIHTISYINWMKQDSKIYIDNYNKKKAYLMTYQCTL